MIYDLKTSNTSFVKLAQQLKDKGVKSYADHLILYDKDLVGVDPFSEDLTSLQKTKIFTELTINPWYWFREVVRFDNGTDIGVMFDCRIGSYMIVWSHIKNINTFAVLSRQLGKTTTHLAFYAWLMLFSVKNQNIVFSLQEYNAKKIILSKWRWFIDALPAWLKPLVTDYADQNSTEEKSLAKQKNKILCYGGAVNDEGADRSARSFSTSNLYLDEVAFFKQNQAFYEAAAQATNAAIRSAKANGTHYGIHMTTTPNRRDEGSPHGHWAYNFFNSAAPFRYEILDYTDEELTEYLHNNSYNGGTPNGFLRLEFDWRQSGMPQSYYDNSLRQIGNNLKKIKQELDLEWPLTDDGSVFSEEEMDIVDKFANKEVVQTLKLVKDKYYLDFYEEMNPFATYLISIDTASGEGLDGTAINLIDPIDYHIVASLNNNRLDGPDLKELIMELMQIWFKEAYLIIEGAPIAVSILQDLIRIPNIERRTFKYLIEREIEMKLSDGKIQTSKQKVWKYGVSTNNKTRPLMMDLLRTIVRDTPYVITSPLVYKDIKNLQYVNGVIKAAPGLHDDSLMAYIIARWAIAYTNYFKNKKFIGGTLTKDILATGSLVYDPMGQRHSGFHETMTSGTSGLSPLATNSKSISSIGYGEEAERKAKEEADKNKQTNRNKFRNLMY